MRPEFQMYETHPSSWFLSVLWLTQNQSYLNWKTYPSLRHWRKCQILRTGHVGLASCWLMPTHYATCSYPQQSEAISLSAPLTVAPVHSCTSSPTLYAILAPCPAIYFSYFSPFPGSQNVYHKTIMNFITIKKLVQDSHSNDLEEHYILGCATVQSGISLPMFRINLLSPPAELNSKTCTEAASKLLAGQPTCSPKILEELCEMRDNSDLRSCVTFKVMTTEAVNKMYK